jgi:ribonuclease HII
MDEVGRGAWAGPVVVGVVVVDAATAALPEGVRDSKLLSPSARCDLAPTIASWCASWALGEATPKEIDRLGMTRALTLAAWRALRRLEVRPETLLLDGPFDFVATGRRRTGEVAPEVTTVVGGDRISGTIAAASILAKVNRDGRMDGLARSFPDYGFDQHKGYGTREHEAAIALRGLTPQHRRSWSFADRLCPNPTLFEGAHAG